MRDLVEAARLLAQLVEARARLPERERHRPTELDVFAPIPGAKTTAAEQLGEAVLLEDDLVDQTVGSIRSHRRRDRGDGVLHIAGLVDLQERDAGDWHGRPLAI